MVAKKMSASERWLAKKMESPAFRAEFEQSRRETDAVDGLIRIMDERRDSLGISKTELARRVGHNEAAVRRLLTAGGNPTLATVVEILTALGLVLKVEEATPLPTRAPTKPSRAKSKPRAEVVA
jgi:DNA-binding phage protein